MVTMGSSRKSRRRSTSTSIEKGNGAGFGQHLVGEDARELVLADHHLDVDAEVVGIAEDFDDAADGRARGRGPTGDFDIDDEAFEIVVMRWVLAALRSPRTRCGVAGCAARASPGRRG